jgi:hypothetical protein
VDVGFTVAEAAALVVAVTLGVGLPVSPGVEKGVVLVGEADDAVTSVLGAVAVVVALVADVVPIVVAGDVGRPVTAVEVIDDVVVVLELEQPAIPIINNSARMDTRLNIFITLFFIANFLIYLSTFRLLLQLLYNGDMRLHVFIFLLL